jgi:hypothetical protein
MDDFNAGQWLARRLAWERVLNEWRRREAEKNPKAAVPIKRLKHRKASHAAGLRRRTAVA